MDRHQYKLGFAKPHGAKQQIPWGYQGVGSSDGGKTILI